MYRIFQWALSAKRIVTGKVTQLLPPRPQTPPAGPPKPSSFLWRLFKSKPKALPPQILTLEEALQAFDARRTSRFFVWATTGSAVAYVSVLAGLEYTARYKPDTLYLWVNQYMTKQLLEGDATIPTSAPALAIIAWLEETWWLQQDIKSTAILPELIEMLRNGASYSYLFDLYQRVFSNPELRKESIDRQAPGVIMMNQRPDLPIEGILLTTDQQLLRTLLGTEESVVQLVESEYWAELLNITVDPDSNYVKSLTLLDKVKSNPKAWRKLRPEEQKIVDRRIRELETFFNRTTDEILFQTRTAMPAFFPELTTSYLGAPLVAAVTTGLWAGARWYRFALSTRLWQFSRAYALNRIFTRTFKSMGLSVLAATLWDRVYFRRGMKSIRESENYYVAGAWYLGLVGFFYKGLAAVPFCLAPLIITSSILAPPKSPM